METCCELWFINLINIRVRVVLSLLKPAHSMLTLKRPKIYILNHIKYLMQSSTWTLKLDTRIDKVLRRFVRVYPNSKRVMKVDKVKGKVHLRSGHEGPEGE